ncbi:hypothetical protein DOFOFD_11850 [Acetobacteraceae bacterium EV16P]|uniref:Uncharacterized protein n=1 Tax=Sorlinia euscelidii TaxID=3081148 RepID=A0ABU7U6Q7_9PROT
MRLLTANVRPSRVDAVFDSVSVVTTFRETLRAAGCDFLPDFRGDPGA